MSSLHCPARVLVARHGDAEYETDLCSDHGGSLTPLGRKQARELASSLAGERVARVWTSPLSRAVQTAEIVAGVLGTDVVVREGLREYSVGALAGTTVHEKGYFEGVFRAWVEGDESAAIEGGERISDVVARVEAVLGEIADEHRGETALVVSHGGAMLATLPQLAGLPRSRGWGVSLPNCAVLGFDADADGWRVTRWDGP
ncbi:histidine phosphatase family protein [Nocardioides panaciterrulae]|uniref:Putative phosphoglycerate mutase n=1 Tax=Nocardioides panaciterrulae TaxID=661492 RepID=A0A7Y9E4T6_9ACTN|nr:histidine phosphatase family protein [Nocardioides panaciterrulae]NYD41261.1 putative phosphoglycerate mutase [Nocardioides panaciterrulae]